MATEKNRKNEGSLISGVKKERVVQWRGLSMDFFSVGAVEPGQGIREGRKKDDRLLFSAQLSLVPLILFRTTTG